MDEILNRPLFRRREARDRLNEMAGVQGYQAGGPVRSGMEMEARRVIPSPILRSEPSRPPSGIESALMATDPYLMETFAPAQTTQRPKSARELAAEQTGGTLRSALSSLADMGAGSLSAAGSGLYGAAADVLSPAFATLGATTIAAQLERQSDIAYNVARSNLANGLSATEGMSPEDFDMEPAEFNFVVARAEADAREEARIKKSLPSPTGPSGMEMEARGSVPPSSAMGRSGMEMEARGSRPIAPLGVSGMEAEARGSRPAAAAPGTTPAAPVPAAQGPSGMEMEARDRGPLITNPAAVAEGLNAPDPAVREKTAADFMQEYMANAPKYEGADRNLMHAMIGFAIAAGDSPNAMTNIANGLLAGSEMMMKDKAEKAAFDRQIQLNAMQYGLEGVAKEREKGRPELQFTAVKDMVWKGRRVKEGQPVYLSYNDIENAGGVVPDGLLDAATYTGLIEKQAGVREVLQDQYDRGLIDDAELRQNMDDYTVAATNVARSQRALDYFERALFKIGKDGTITGIPGAFQKLVGKMSAAAGFSTSELDALAKSGDAAEMEELLLRGVLDTVPSVVEGQSANSISDTDVRLAIRRLVALATEQGSFSSLFTSEDTVIRQVQDAMNLIAGNRQRAFSAMSAIEGRLANRVTKAGDFYSPAYASDLLVPLRESAGLSMQPDALSSYGDMVLQEDGSYKLIFPEG